MPKSGCCFFPDRHRLRQNSSPAPPSLVRESSKSERVHLPLPHSRLVLMFVVVLSSNKTGALAAAESLYVIKRSVFDGAQPKNDHFLGTSCSRLLLTLNIEGAPSLVPWMVSRLLCHLWRARYIKWQWQEMCLSILWLALETLNEKLK